MARTKKKTRPASSSRSELVNIPARYGRAAFVKKGQRVKVINTHGTQVVDCWAFNADNLGEFMSMEHTRATLVKIMPATGDHMYTNRRRPILTIKEDTTPGIHDTLMAACDDYRYGLLGCTEYHDNCTDNLWQSLVDLKLKPVETPCPLNLWQNTPVTDDGSIEQLPTVAARGDHVLFRAEIDLMICLSCCPQDIMPINSMKPRGARFEILDRGT